MGLPLLRFFMSLAAIGRGVIMEQIRLEAPNLLEHGIGVHYQVSERGEAGKRANLYYERFCMTRCFWGMWGVCKASSFCRVCRHWGSCKICGRRV